MADRTDFQRGLLLEPEAIATVMKTATLVGIGRSSVLPRKHKTTASKISSEMNTIYKKVYQQKLYTMNYMQQIYTVEQLF